MTLKEDEIIEELKQFGEVSIEKVQEGGDLTEEEEKEEIKITALGSGERQLKVFTNQISRKVFSDG